jgi:diacylglycerol kinase family enzyme
MSKTQVQEEEWKGTATLCPIRCANRPRIALLSNPKSTRNLAELSRIRNYCADHPDIFHYEVERAEQIGHALNTIARVRPRMLVINGGDGTVQSALTEMHNGRYFGDQPPPVSVLPSGKTNLIALDLGVRGDPIVALERLVEIAQGDLAPHIVAREVIALRKDGSERPVIGMFMGGAGLADTMLFCRNKIYPLGLPNGLSHALAGIALFMRALLKLKAGFLPPPPQPTELVLRKRGRLSGRFVFLAVTTLEKLLLASQLGGEGRGRLKFVAIEERPASVVRAILAGIAGGYKGKDMRGIHFAEVDEIEIEADSSSVILDGEIFRTEKGRPIRLKPAEPLSFVKLAA